MTNARWAALCILLLRNLWIGQTMRVEVTFQCATLWDVASTKLAGVPEMYADGAVYMMRACCSGGRFGPIIACPMSVLALLEVIAATMGDDLAVVVEGL